MIILQNMARNGFIHFSILVVFHLMDKGNRAVEDCGNHWLVIIANAAHLPDE
ncbi:MAG: hypothetical protein GY797_23860 [Deltaproteobacteria bacterium]|nr:hypothetical protein [Deltaproteobacteria bacterium]